MTHLLETLRQMFQMKSFYIGAVLWTLAAIVTQTLQKEDGKPTALGSVLNLVLLLIASYFLIEIVRRLREPFTTTRPTQKELVLAFLAFGAKLCGLFILFILPVFAIVFGGVFLGLGEIATTGVVIAYCVIVGLVLIVLMYGAMGLLALRGSSRATIVQGIPAALAAWKAGVLMSLLASVPIVLSAPFLLLGRTMVWAAVVAKVIPVAFAPYNFAILIGIYLVMGKAIGENAPRFRELSSGPAPVPAATPAPEPPATPPTS